MKTEIRDAIDRLTFPTTFRASEESAKALGPSTKQSDGGRGEAFSVLLQPRERYLWELSQGRGYFCADGSVRQNDDDLIRLVLSVHD